MDLIIDGVSFSASILPSLVNGKLEGVVLMIGKLEHFPNNRKLIAMRIHDFNKIQNFYKNKYTPSNFNYADDSYTVPYTFYSGDKDRHVGRKVYDGDKFIVSIEPHFILNAYLNEFVIHPWIIYYEKEYFIEKVKSIDRAKDSINSNLKNKERKAKNVL